jgi:hypothetical protein
MLHRSAAAIVAAALVGFGCSSPAKPSSPDISALQGIWASSVPADLPSGCTDFTWSVTNITGNTGSGTFKAACAGFQVNGSASGTLEGSTVTWSANASLTGPGGFTCPIALTGTATFDGTELVIPYSGTACFVAVSGTEHLKKK